MKKIVFGIMLLFNLQIYAQQPKDGGFSQKVFSGDFTENDKNIWPQKNNEFYFLLVKDSAYIIQCQNDEKKAYLLPKDAPRMDTFMLEALFTPDTRKIASGVAGIAFDIQDKLSGGYLVEINNKKQYRLVSLDGQGGYNILSNKGKANGWAPYKLKSGAERVKISVIQLGKKAYIYFDEMEMMHFDNATEAPGQCGLFIQGIYGATVRQYALYKANGTGGTGTKTDTKTGTDISTLNNALIECRDQNKDLAAKLETCKQETAQSRMKNKELQTYISQNLDMKLQDELKNQKEKADKLEAENKKLNAEMEDLRTLKKTIDENNDADLVTVLSENLKKEQQKNAVLEKKIKDLTTKKPRKK